LPLAELLSRNNEVAKFLGERQSERVFEVNAAHRGVLKQALLAAYPAEDLAGYVAGDALDLQLRSTAQSGAPFLLEITRKRRQYFIKLVESRAAAV